MESINTSSSSVVGILYPGEMGAALADVLLARGFNVITTLNGRSSRTQENCKSSGIATRNCVADVVRESDVVLSTVTPNFADTMAEEVSQAAERRDRSLTYIDMNSVSPGTAGRMADRIQDSGMGFVDATIHGIASRLKTQGTVFASGPDAAVLNRLFGTDVRVQVLGDDPGRASMMKMMLGGMSKGIIGLFLQSSQLAQNFDMTDEFCHELGRYYPDVLSFVERSLPTYGQHAGRRAEEMREFAATLQSSELPTEMALELSTQFSALDESSLAFACNHEPKPLKLKRLVDLIAATRLPVKPKRSDITLV